MLAAAWKSSDTPLLITVIVLLTFSGFFALAETSLVRMSRSRAAALKEDGRRGSAALERLAKSPDQFLNPLLLLILVCQLVSATLVGVLAEHLFGTAGLIVATTFEVVVIFVLFEAIPKNFAVLHANSSALLAAPIVEVILKFWPIKWISTVLLSISKFALRPFGVGDESGKVTESEIIAMATVAANDSSIDVSERDYIHSVLELGDTVVREVMVPRVDIIALSGTTTVNEALQIAAESGKSRLPVEGENVDDIIGVANIRWLFREQQAGNGERALADLGLNEPHFVPETRKVSALIRDFQERRLHLFIVVDEYGGTAGIVTLEDVLEELIGEIVDESDPVPSETRDGESPENVGALVVSGRSHIEDVNADHDLSLPSGSWDTVAGLVLDLAAGVPSAGDVFEKYGYRFRVVSVERHRVASVAITPLEEE